MTSGDDRRPAIGPHLALRVAVLGGLALTLFAVVFFRLWFLQVLSGEEYVSEARENRTRTVRIQPPRGEIRDRNGDPIVTNRLARVVQLMPNELPEAERRNAAAWGQAMGRREQRAKGRKGEPIALPPIATPALERRYRRLGRVLGLSAQEIHQRVVEQLVRLPYAPITVASDVDFSQIQYLQENKARFRGVEPEEQYVRRYPKGTLAAQLLGTVGRLTPEQAELRRYRGVDKNAVVGQTGLEYEYDRYLRGRDGARVLRVNADGELFGTATRVREPRPGRDLRLSLDLALQRAGQDAVASIGGGNPGAFVAMNPYSGRIHAMGSYPSFDPTVFTKPIPDERYEEIFGEEAGSPQLNRATQSAYPTGSTLKPLTAIAALDSGALASPETPVFDGGTFQIGNRVARNSGGAAYGSIALRRALQVSSTVFFYKLGAAMFSQGGEPLQRWLRRFGLGRETGVDLPEDSPGRVPGRKQRQRLNELERKCQQNPAQPEGVPCYVDEIRPYNAGDNVNLAIGQGEIAASPLQMAVAYSTVIADGRVPRPHLGMEVLTGDGELVQRISPAPARRVRIDDAARDAVLDGLALGAQVPPGTSSSVFASWPKDRLPVRGKTGTAENPSQGGDQSWYVGFVEAGRNQSLVVAATVERGGFGAERAAPVVCQIMRSWYDVGPQACAGRATATVGVAQDG